MAATAGGVLSQSRNEYDKLVTYVKTRKEELESTLDALPPLSAMRVASQKGSDAYGRVLEIGTLASHARASLKDPLKLWVSEFSFKGLGVWD